MVYGKAELEYVKVDISLQAENELGVGGKQRRGLGGRRGMRDCKTRDGGEELAAAGVGGGRRAIWARQCERAAKL